MEEARQVKSALYPLSRDIKNLATFVINIRNILQAEPERFAVVAPPGLLPMRRTLKSLSKSTLAIQEVNDIAMRESCVAEELAARSMLPILRPAARLRDASRSMKDPLNRAHSLVTRLNGYLNPLFMFAITANPEIELFQGEVEVTEQRIGEVKRIISRLTDQEVILGLTPVMQTQLETLRPQIQELESEIENICQQMGLLMGKMNQLSKLNNRLLPLMRMAAAMDGAIQELVPAMSMLKHLAGVFSRVQRELKPAQNVSKELEFALQQYEIPMDAMLQVEFALQHQVEHYIEPVLEPLAELAEQLKQAVPGNHLLHGLESTLIAQHGRFSMVAKRVERIFNKLDIMANQGSLAVQA